MHMNGRGMTAIVDAMAFIMVMGIVISVAFNISNEDLEIGPDASKISETILYSTIRMTDLHADAEPTLIGISDLIAVSMRTGDDAVFDYIKNVLNAHLSDPARYRMDFEYGDMKMGLGSGFGIPLSESTMNVSIVYGGSLKVTLSLS